METGLPEVPEMTTLTELIEVALLPTNAAAATTDDPPTMLTVIDVDVPDSISTR